MEEKVIGQRVTPKMNAWGIRMGVILLIFGAMLCIFASFGSSDAKLYSIIGGVAVVLAILTITLLVVLQARRKKVKDLPTIVLEEGNVLRLYLLNGTTKKVAVQDIVTVKSVRRHSMNFYGLVLQHVWNPDGTITFKLKDNTTINVSGVDQVEKVAEVIKTLCNEVK